MDHQTDWDQLQYLLAVARTKTFSKAARTLRVNHTTVARQVRALEQRYGAKLIEQSKGGFSLTAAGERAVATGQRIEREMACLEMQLIGRDARLCGRLTVTTFDAVATRLAPDFAAFCRRYPDIQLEITAALTPRNLVRREADIAIRATNAPPEHLVGRKAYHYAYALYGHHSLADDARGDLEDLPWLGWDPGVAARVTDRWMRRHVPNARVVLRVDTMAMMNAAILQGLGVAFLPCLWSDEQPELRRLRPIDPTFGIDLWLLTAPELRGTARVRAFMDHFEDALARLPRPAPDGPGPAPDGPGPACGQNRMSSDQAKLSNETQRSPSA